MDFIGLPRLIDGGLNVEADKPPTLWFLFSDETRMLLKATQSISEVCEFVVQNTVAGFCLHVKDGKLIKADGLTQPEAAGYWSIAVSQMNRLDWWEGELGTAMSIMTMSDTHLVTDLLYDRIPRQSLFSRFFR